MDTPREGLELAKKLEASANLSEIPIILITCIETISASDATAEIVRKTLTKYRQNDLDVLIIMSLNGEIKVEYKSADDNSLVRLQVEGYHPKPINTEKLIREINQLLNQ
jgi:CheY-like chemotaxis protein